MASKAAVRGLVWCSSLYHKQICWRQSGRYNFQSHLGSQRWYFGAQIARQLHSSQGTLYRSEFGHDEARAVNEEIDQALHGAECIKHFDDVFLHIDSFNMQNVSKALKRLSYIRNGKEMIPRQHLTMLEEKLDMLLMQRDPVKLTHLISLILSFGRLAEHADYFCGDKLWNQLQELAVMNNMSYIRGPQLTNLFHALLYMSNSSENKAILSEFKDALLESFLNSSKLLKQCSPHNLNGAISQIIDLKSNEMNVSHSETVDGFDGDDTSVDEAHPNNRIYGLEEREARLFGLNKENNEELENDQAVPMSLLYAIDLRLPEYTAIDFYRLVRIMRDRRAEYPPEFVSKVLSTIPSKLDGLADLQLATLLKNSWKVSDENLDPKAIEAIVSQINPENVDADRLSRAFYIAIKSGLKLDSLQRVQTCLAESLRNPSISNKTATEICFRTSWSLWKMHYGISKNLLTVVQERLQKCLEKEDKQASSYYQVISVFYLAMLLSKKAPELFFPKLLTLLDAHLCKNMDFLKAGGLRALLSVWGVLGSQPSPQLTRLALAHFSNPKLLDALSLASVSHTLLTFATLRQQDMSTASVYSSFFPDVTDRFCHLVETSDDVEPRALAQGILGLQKADIDIEAATMNKVEELFEGFVQLPPSTHSNFKGSTKFAVTDFSTLIWCFAIKNYLPAIPTLEKAASFFEKNMGNMNSHSITSVVWSFSVFSKALKVDSDDAVNTQLLSEDLLRRLDKRCVNDEHFMARGLEKLVYSLESLGHEPSEKLQKLIKINNERYGNAPWYTRPKTLNPESSVNSAGTGFGHE